MTTLLIWSNFPESTYAYKVTGHAEVLALQSAGLYINSSETAGTAVEELCTLLGNDERNEEFTQLDDEVVMGPFENVVMCGIIA
jgi:hypothetical protein